MHDQTEIQKTISGQILNEALPGFRESGALIPVASSLKDLPTIQEPQDIRFPPFHALNSVLSGLQTKDFQLIVHIEIPRINLQISGIFRLGS